MDLLCGHIVRFTVVPGQSFILMWAWHILKLKPGFHLVVAVF